MTIRASVAVSAATGAMLLVPAVAQATTKTVDVGVPTKSAQKFQNVGADVNAFFLRTVTIRAGDTVRFRPTGFHTVDFPVTGGDPIPLLAPTGQKVAGVNDANGAPFWFNGQDQVGFNPLLLAAGGFGKRFSYRGGKAVNSGAPFGPNLKPMAVKFPKPGTYRYYCDVHDGMDGQVVVRRKSAKIPTARQDKRRRAKQIATALSRAKKLAATTPPAGTAYVGSAGKGGVEYYGMVPATLNVAVGTTVTFASSPRSYEVHTATFGPGVPEEQPNSYLAQIASTFADEDPVIDPRGVYPSEMPGSPPAAFTSLLHGNGFWNSGLLDQSPNSSAPASNTVTFGTAGTYDFYCMAHPFMHGRIVVG